jgi:hypothetical protein
MTKSARFVLGALAIGLLALGGWKAYSRLRVAPPVAAQERWQCPMRCLRKVYDHAGKCPVCHMDLVKIDRVQARPAHFDPWQKIGGRSAVYFRPYEVRKVQVDRLLRVAGSLSNDHRHLEARLPVGETAPKRGSSVMLMPALGYMRPILGTVERLGKDGRIGIKASRAMDGFDQVSAEIRLPGPLVLAVPLEALQENADLQQVFVRTGSGAGEAYAPRNVRLGQRGERFAEVLGGLAEGDVIAGSGLFWLEAQWRMDHPPEAAP